MAFVIKAGTRGVPAQSPRPAAFNLEDVSHSATQYVETANQRATDVVARAQQQATQIREQAKEEGFRQGLDAARMAAREEVSEHWQTLRPALEQAVREIEQAKSVWLHHWEQQVARLAAAIAEKLIHRELTHSAQLSQKWIHDALELAAGCQHLKIYMNPKDLEALNATRQAMVDIIGTTATVDMIADNTITSGGCRVVTEHGEIDTRLETQLARIATELAD